LGRAPSSASETRGPPLEKKNHTQQQHRAPQRAEAQAAPRAEKLNGHSSGTARGNELRNKQNEKQKIFRLAAATPHARRNGLNHKQGCAQKAPRAQQQHRTRQGLMYKQHRAQQKPRAQQ
jgi:hypothetical protein